MRPNRSNVDIGQEKKRYFFIRTASHLNPYRFRLVFIDQTRNLQSRRVIEVVRLLRNLVPLASNSGRNATSNLGLPARTHTDKPKLDRRFSARS